MTKEQRDEHIRRYADLLEVQLRQNVAIESKREDGRGHRPEGAASVIARETGLSKRTVERALNPKPVPIKSVVEPESEEEAIIREANAIVSAWNRARQATLVHAGSFPALLGPSLLGRRDAFLRRQCRSRLLVDNPFGNFALCRFLDLTWAHPVHNHFLAICHDNAWKGRLCRVCEKGRPR